jgi:hypothetical protein
MSNEIESKPIVNHAIIEDLAKFEASALKQVKVTEKTVLPSKEGELMFFV